jgi:ADP-ribose pyrophosphatase YjhB (NUDIX family)
VSGGEQRLARLLDRRHGGDQAAMAREGAEFSARAASMARHGHVTPLPGGLKARCGGPALCTGCQAEQAALEAGSSLAKAHIPGYTKKDGTVVREHERGGGAALPEPAHHPRAGEKGEPVLIKRPHVPTAPSTWAAPDAVATFVPDGDVPRELNGVPFRRWKDHPTTDEGWDYVDGVNDDLAEPPVAVPAKKYLASGVVIEEPDGRVWVIHPSNEFGGYKASFPKGTAEPEMSLQANAIKEAFEESGLQVEIVGFLGDFERSMSVARMYRAVRIGGDPTDVGWESQGVSLVPKAQLYDHLNHWGDHGVAEAVGAGPAPKKPPPPPAQPAKWGSGHLF